MMSAADKLLVAILKYKDDTLLFRVKDEWFDTSEIPKLRFVLDYIGKHDELVGVKTFCSTYSLDASEADSRPGVYFRQVRERYLFTEVADKVPDIIKNAKKNPSKSVKDLAELVSKLSSDEDVDSIDVRYSENADDRVDKYKTRVANSGITYSSMGNPILDEIFMGYTETDLITIGGRAGSKKCLAKGTRIRMYDGSVKTVETIKVNDLIMGDDGSPRKVLTLYTGREQMYWVHQNKGDSYRVNESHILSLKNKRPISIRERGSRENRTYLGSAGCSNEIVNISVKEYLTKSKTWKKYHKGWRATLNFNKQSVLIDPYFLGIWLGDGGSHKIEITTEDIEIVDYINEYAKKLNLSVTQNKNQYSITNTIQGNSNTLTSLFRQYNLLNNKSNKIDKGSKRIPMEYIRNSREVRLQLLAGLIDSDGCYANGVILITQKSKKLAHDIAFLARSLGYHVNINDKAIAKLKSRDYTCKVTSLCISGDFKDLPTKLKRKQTAKRLINKDVTITGIEVVKDVVDDFYGFEIDGNHLFCLEDLTVTHNTFLLCYLAILADEVLPEQFGNITFLTNEMSIEQIIDRMDCIRFYLPFGDFLRGRLLRPDVVRYRKGTSSLTKSRIVFMENVYTMDEYHQKMKIYRPGLAFIDGSYLMEPEYKGDDWKRITYITRRLKRIAKTMKIPHVNTTQLKRASGGKQSSTSFGAQDDFAYASSYTQDSDVAIKMYADKEMQYRNEVGMEIAKGRNIDVQKIPVFVANLVKMDFHFILTDANGDETEPPVNSTLKTNPAKKSTKVSW